MYYYGEDPAIAFYFLQCCKIASYNDGGEVGLLPVVWRESAGAQEFGVQTRRFSGFELPVTFSGLEQ